MARGRWKVQLKKGIWEMKRNTKGRTRRTSQVIYRAFLTKNRDYRLMIFYLSHSLLLLAALFYQFKVLITGWTEFFSVWEVLLSLPQQQQFESENVSIVVGLGCTCCLLHRDDRCVQWQPHHLGSFRLGSVRMACFSAHNWSHIWANQRQKRKGFVL